MFVMTGFRVFMALLQAYIFTILSDRGASSFPSNITINTTGCNRRKPLWEPQHSPPSATASPPPGLLRYRPHGRRNQEATARQPGLLAAVSSNMIIGAGMVAALGLISRYAAHRRSDRAMHQIVAAADQEVGGLAVILPPL